jgi:hypothetical protein
VYAATDEATEMRRRGLAAWGVRLRNFNSDNANGHTSTIERHLNRAAVDDADVPADVDRASPCRWRATELGRVILRRDNAGEYRQDERRESRN